MGKLVWGEDNPFCFPPNEFNFGVLQAVEPFLTIHRTPGVSALRDDKFGGGMVDKDVLSLCLNLINEGVAAFARSYSSRTEGNMRPIRLEMIRQIEQFTKPTSSEFDLLIQDNPDVEGFYLACGDPADDEQNDEQEYEPQQVVHEDSENSGDSSQEGMSMGTELGPADVRTTGRTDCRVYVHDKGPAKRKDLPELEIPRLDSQCCAALAEFKIQELREAIAQCGAYGRPEVRRNISNRHYKPVYLIACTKSKFTYAVLKAEGTILTGGTRVSDEAYEDFVGTTDPRTTPCSREKINGFFSMGSKFLRQNYTKSRATVLYPKKHYIVGDLYLASEWYALPTTEVDGGMHSAGAKKFYEGLLRVAVGDRVLNWGVGDALAASSARMMQSKMQGARGGGDLKLNMLVRLMQLGIRMGKQVQMNSLHKCFSGGEEQQDMAAVYDQFLQELLSWKWQLPKEAPAGCREEDEDERAVKRLCS